MTVNLKDWIGWIVRNWSNFTSIKDKFNWDGIQELFKKGDKKLFFVKNLLAFQSFLKISESTYAKKFKKYIINTKWNSYLIRSIEIKNLYDSGKKEDADRKKQILNREGVDANRICNLYCSGILDALFQEIISFEAREKSFAEISNSATRKLQDFINEEALIYVNNIKSKDDLLADTQRSLNNKRFCILIGTGNDNIEKITQVFGEIQKLDSSWQIRSNLIVKGGGIRELTGFISKEEYIEIE